MDSERANVLSWPPRPDHQPASALLTCYDFLLRTEPRVLEIMLDVKSAMITDNLRAIRLARMFCVPHEVRTEYDLDPTHGVLLTAFPAFIWELVYG
jgi:hypothetical protein